MKLTHNQSDLLKRIQQGQHIVCFHILGQELADALCAIVSAQDCIIQTTPNDDTTRVETLLAQLDNITMIADKRMQEIERLRNALLDYDSNITILLNRIENLEKR